MTENVPQSREVQLQYFSSFLPQLSPLTVFSWLNSLQDRLFCSHPQAHSLLKELYVPGIESQKSALSFSLSSLVSKFSSKVAKEKKKKRKKERKKKKALHSSRRGLMHPDCPDSLLVVAEPLCAAAGVPAPCAHSILWRVTVFILKR